STTPPTPCSSTLSLHDALPISLVLDQVTTSPLCETALPFESASWAETVTPLPATGALLLEVTMYWLAAPGLTVIAALSPAVRVRSEEHTSELQSRSDLVCRLLL